MDLNNNQMLLLAVAAVALYFFMKYRKCSKKENFLPTLTPVTCKNTKKYCLRNKWGLCQPLEQDCRRRNWW
jgi:hypothetical protein